jgi:hypothetical protein
MTALCVWQPTGSASAADQWEHGYALGKRVKKGDDLPHPQDAHVWYHAVRAALHPRGLTISMFMRVIPLPTNVSTAILGGTSPWCVDSECLEERSSHLKHLGA